MNSEQVEKDVDVVINCVNEDFPERLHLFEIFLRRSDSHIAAVCESFRNRFGSGLVEEILEFILSPLTKDILLYAIETAVDISSRDKRLIRESLIDHEEDEKFPIRVCRMHWCNWYWQAIGDYFAGSGVNLENELKRNSANERLW